jgi:hypothetical protein
MARLRPPEAAGRTLSAAGEPDPRGGVGFLAPAAHGGRRDPLVGHSLGYRPVGSVRVVVQQHQWERAARHAVSHYEQRHLVWLLPRHVLGDRLGEDGLAAGRAVVRRGGHRGRRERPRAPLSHARQADSHDARGCHASASRGLSRSGTTTALWRLRTSSQLLRTP